MIDNLKSSDTGLRLATIDLINKCAQDGFPYQTEQPDVNGETTLEVIRDLAHGVDRNGNKAVQDERVRRAAADTLALMESKFIVQDVSNPASDEKDSAVSEAPKVASLQRSQPAKDEFAAPPSSASALRRIARETTAAAKATPAPAPVAAPVRTMPAVTPANSGSAIETPTKPIHALATTAKTTPRSQPIHGIVDSVDVVGETATLRFGNSLTPPRKARVIVTHRYVLGRLQTIGEFETTNVAPGRATIRPIAGTSISRISSGDAAVAFGE